METQTLYIFDVGTSFKIGKPFFDRGVYWFDAGFAHIKCKTVEFWEVGRYAKHLVGCQAPFKWYKRKNPCTCGLDKYLNAITNI